MSASRANRNRVRQDEWSFLPPGTERLILLLRWLALLLVVVLHWFDRLTAGVLFPLPQVAVVVVAYNAMLLLSMRAVRWLRRPLNYLALDTLVAALAVFLTGGYHSSFFVLFIFIIIGAAFFLELVATIVVALGVGLVYVGACYVNPAGLLDPSAQYMLAAKLFGLMVVGVLCGLLLEQLRREHRETERERALAQRLKVLNELFQQLNTTLDLDRTLQMVAEAPRSLQDADLTCIALLDKVGGHLFMAAAAGIDVALMAGRQWPVDDALASAVMSRGQPYLVDKPELFSRSLPQILAQEGRLRAIQMIVSVPLLLNHALLGVLDVAYGENKVVTKDDLAFLAALGHEAALAIRNARLYAREREQVLKLQALDKLQDGFVSAVSHELCTPLTCIRTSTDLLQATSRGLSEEQLDLVNTIGHHTGRLETLVADLLEITKLEAGQVVLAPQLTDLRRTVRNVVDALHPLIERKGQRVRLSLPERASQVEVDRRRIEQVLTNVLSNAIKFTPKKGEIDVRLTETDDGLLVAVADNGPGIPARDQTRVFDRFYVVDNGRGLSGVGLGLFIAQQMTALHGGRIWVESQPGQGSTFYILVPKVREERQ